MSSIYSKIKASIYALNDECDKKLSNGTKSPNGFAENDEYLANEIIINVLDENNNNHIIISEEDVKPQIVTRTLINRSESVASQPTRKVSNSARIAHFIDAVKEMNQFVLIPSLLRDIDIGGEETVPLALEGCDLHTGYQLLNSLKNSLLYSATTSVPNYEVDLPPKLIKQQSIIDNKKEYLKELSVDGVYSSIGTQDSGPKSLSSASSVNMDDDDSSLGVDIHDLATNFYHHLHGLNAELERLIEAAKFIVHSYERNSLS